jgi:hypothetical protein
MILNRISTRDRFSGDAATVANHQNDWKFKDALNKKSSNDLQEDGRRDASGRDEVAAAAWHWFNPPGSSEMFSSAHGTKSENPTVDYSGLLASTSLGSVPQVKIEPPTLERGPEERPPKPGKWPESTGQPAFMSSWDVVDAEQSMDKSRGDADRTPHRAVASVAPTQMGGGGLMDDGLGMPSADPRHALLPHYPPPLVPLHSSPDPHRPMADIGSGSTANSELNFDNENRHFASAIGRGGGTSAIFDRHGGGVSPPPVLRDRSRSPSGCQAEESESDSERENIRRSPSPEPQMTNIEFYRSKNAM